jgi:hypothetical protein
MKEVTFKNGKCSLTSTITEFITALPDTMDDAIASQYGFIRSSEFKHFLKCAATIGTRFSLIEVAAIWYDSFEDLSLLVKQYVKPPSVALIHHLEILMDFYDTFGMLSVCKDPLDGEDSMTPFEVTYMFKASCACEVIKTIGERSQFNQARHARLIALYETEITDSTEVVFIPLLCRHYEHAQLHDRTFLMKRIAYLEMMGTYMISSIQSYVEARFIYAQIQEIVEYYSLEDDYGSNVLAIWKTQLSFAHNHGVIKLIDTDLAVSFAKEGLRLLNVKWPANDKKWASFRLKENASYVQNSALYYLINKPIQEVRDWINSRLFLESLGGTVLSGRVARSAKDFEESEHIRNLESLQPILSIICDYLFHTHAKLDHQISFELLYLNSALRLGRNLGMAKARVFASLSLNYWFLGKMYQSEAMLKKADIHLEGRSEDLIDPTTIAIMCHQLTASGMWSRSYVCAEKGLRISLRKGTKGVYEIF